MARDNEPGAGAPLRALFVNENLGGHRALHRYLEGALSSMDDVEATFVHVPPPRLGRRVIAASVPGLARPDADLQPLRAQLAASSVAARMAAPALAGADVVHVYSQNAALLWPKTVRERPTVVATDSTNAQNAYMLPYRTPTRFTPATMRLTRLFEQRVYDAATLVVAQSEWAARSIIDDYGVDRSRVRMVRYGIPVRQAPVRRTTDTPEITFVGTTLERKGGNRLLDTFRRSLRGRAVLNLVTPEPVAEEPGVRVHCDVTPGDGKLAEILARTAVFAFPSSIDKSSFAVMEAMAAGVPAVVMSTGGLAELVEDGVSGIVVDDAPESLDAAVLELLDDPSRCEAMGRAARARAAAAFDAEVTTRQAIDVLREAVELFSARPSAASRRLRDVEARGHRRRHRP